MMFTYDEKKFFHGEMKTECTPPHPRKHYSLPEQVDCTARELRATLDRFMNLERTMKEKYDDHVRIMTEDNVTFKSVMENAWSDFVSAVRSEINLYETNVDAIVSLFKQAVNDRIAEFNEEFAQNFEDYQLHFKEWQDEFETEIRNLYSTHEATINDAVTYMKSNLNQTLETLLYEMKDSGDLIGVIESEVFATPEMFGAIGDGAADDTNAFSSAIATGRPLYLSKTYKVTNVVLPKHVSGFGTIKGNVSFTEMNTNVEGVTFTEGIVTVDCRNSMFTNCHFTKCTGFTLKKWANCFVNCNFWQTEIFIESVNGATNNFIGCYLGGAERLFYGTPANLHISGGWIEENKYIFELDNSGNIYGVTIENCDLESNNNIISALGGVTASITVDNCVILGNSVTTYVINTDKTTTATNLISVLFNGCYTEKVRDFMTARSVNLGIEGLPQHCYTKSVPYTNDVNVSWHVRGELHDVYVPDFEIEEVNGKFVFKLPKPCFIGEVIADGATSIKANRCVNGEFVSTTRSGSTGTFNSSCYSFVIESESFPTVKITTPANIYGGA